MSSDAGRMNARFGKPCKTCGGIGSVLENGAWVECPAICVKYPGVPGFRMPWDQEGKLDEQPMP